MAWIKKSGQHSWRVRYRHTDGSTGSVPGFRTERVARDYAADMNTDQRRGTWIDPAAGRTTLTAWVERWLPNLDLDERTIEGYRTRLRCHILPHFGTTALDDITTLDINVWAKTLDGATSDAAHREGGDYRHCGCRLFIRPGRGPDPHSPTVSADRVGGFAWTSSAS